MALRAVFIGINKYRDPRIHELTGATKDAIALWALFKDSVEGIAAKRLLDDEATVIRFVNPLIRPSAMRLKTIRASYSSRATELQATSLSRSMRI